jgi:hypothetical protein
MNTHGWGVVGVLAVLLIALPIGAAYAYSSTVTSSGNSISGEAHSIDILDSSGNPLTETFGIPAYVQNGSALIEDYSIMTTGPGTVSVVCTMEDSAAWVLIKGMTITIMGEEDDFGVIRTDTVPPVVTTGVPSKKFTIDEIPNATAESYVFSFEIEIQYANVDPAEAAAYSDFAGSKIMFSFEAA